MALPMLATFKGNDLIPFKDLFNFHRNLTCKWDYKFKDYKETFSAVASFIQKKGLDMNLEEFAEKIFKDRKKATKLDVSTNFQNKLHICQGKFSLIVLQFLKKLELINQYSILIKFLLTSLF